MPKIGQMTVSAAGQKGGLKTKATHGHEFYEEIGRKGGLASNQRYKKHQSGDRIFTF